MCGTQEWKESRGQEPGGGHLSTRIDRRQRHIPLEDGRFEMLIYSEEFNLAHSSKERRRVAEEALPRGREGPTIFLFLPQHALRCTVWPFRSQGRI